MLRPAMILRGGWIRIPWRRGALTASLLALVAVLVGTWSHLFWLYDRLGELKLAANRIETAQGVSDGPLSVSPLLLGYELDTPGRGCTRPRGA